jgi:hypothetical protein
VGYKCLYLEKSIRASLKGFKRKRDVRNESGDREGGKDSSASKLYIRCLPPVVVSIETCDPSSHNQYKGKEIFKETVMVGCKYFRCNFRK